jgi:hypothetical protein
VSGEHAPNVPRSGAGSIVTVTIAGLHFGPWNLTPTASLEDSDEATCTTSSWTSATTVACNARRLKSSRVREAMTVAGVVGTSFSFSFDGTAAAQSQPVSAVSRICCPCVVACSADRQLCQPLEYRADGRRVGDDIRAAVWLARTVADHLARRLGVGLGQPRM